MTVTILPAVATAAAIVVVAVVVVTIGRSSNVSQRPMTENINFCYTKHKHFQTYVLYHS
jgi:hypothetical protein